MPKKLSARFIKRYIIPPVLTVGASAFILVEANWLHHHETHPTSVSTSVSGATGTTSPPSLTGLKHHLANAGTSHANTTTVNHSKSDNHSTDVLHSSGKQANQNNTSTPSKTTPTPVGDKGFTPLLGGTLTDSPDPKYLDLSQAFSSLVVQYGSSPQTTFDSTTMASQYGINVTLKLPKTITANQILLLPLSGGVIWAIVPPTAIGASGSLLTSSAPSQLFYTPYGGSNPSNVTLSLSAASLGSIPVTVGGSSVTTSWYHPPVSSSIKAPGNGTTSTASGLVVRTPLTPDASTQTSPTQAAQPPSPNSATSDGAAPGGAGSATTTNSAANHLTAANGTSDMNLLTATSQPQVRTVADAAGTNLYLHGLYKVDGGVVILLRTQRGSASGQWAYYWNESSKTLKPVCSITNSDSQFGWLAVGQHTIFWGERSLIPPQDTYYQGAQHMMTLATGAVRKIQIGDWTAEAVAGQDINSYHSDPDQADDELYFRVHDSPMWKEFVPSATP